MEKEVLQGLNELLNSKNIPAKIYDDEDGMVLSVLFDTIIDNEDVFADIYFAADGQAVEDTYFCSFDFTVKDLSKLPMDEVANIMFRVATVNATLFMGGYSVEADGDTTDVGSLFFGEVVPVTATLQKDKIVDFLFKNLEVLVGSLKLSITDILVTKN